MADQQALLASLLLGQKQRTSPFEQQKKYGQSLIQQGSSTAPINSGNPLEGVARALQAGLGGWVARDADQQETAKQQATLQGMGNYLQAKTPEEEAAALKGLQGGDPDAASALLANLISNKQKLGIANDQAKTFGSVMGGSQPATAPPGQLGGSAQAIAGIESAGQPNGGYGAVGPVANQQGHRAYGKFQVLEPNIGPWTQEIVGKAMSPQEFLANPEAQNKVFEAKFGQYVNKYGSPQAASRAWFAGESGMNNPNATDVNGMTPGRYEQKFSQGLPPGAAQAPGQPLQINVTPGGAAPPNAGGQGDATPPSSVTSGPPEIPRPQPTPEQIKKYQGLIASGGLSQPQALQELDKEITGQWQQQRNQALEVWKDQQSSKRIQEQGAQRLGQEAPMKMIEARVADYEKNVRPKAEAATGDILALHQVRQVLDAGAFTGTGAEYKTQLAKLGEQLGIPSEQAQNTQVLGSALANRVLAGAGGSLGTGFSNADRDFMEKAKGGQITMDEPALRRLADIGERQARQVLKNHDVAAERLQKLPGLAALGTDQFQVQNAPTYDEWNKANPLAPLQTGPVAPQATAPRAGISAPPPAIERLRANPAEAAQFDEIFGPGSAAKVLGR